MNRNIFLRTLGFVLAGAASISSRPAEIHSGEKILKPARLQEGDTIGLIAPAGNIYEESEFTRMLKTLESFGLEGVFARNVRSRYGYLTGTNKLRAEDANRFFKNPVLFSKFLKAG